MWDVARSSFNAQLASVMESLLAAAVREISRIFEGSLSDSRQEVERGREEVALLNRKLEALECRLKEVSSARDRGVGVTLDPSGFAQDAGTGDASLRDGRDQAGGVKEDLEVTEMEFVTFSLDRAVVSMAIKEEQEQDPEPVFEGSPGATGPVGLKAEGAAGSTGPKRLQNPELLRDLLSEPPGFPPEGFRSSGTPRRSGGPGQRAKAGHSPPPEAVDDVIVTASRLRPHPEVTVPTGRPRAPPPQGPPGEKPYPCPRCLKAFISPSHLSVHMRVHTGERPYRCPQCGKSFAHNGNLRAHQRQVHLGKRPYPCAECGKRFSKRGNLRTHLQQVHLGRRPYPCAHCRKAYFSLRDLRTHQIIHAAQ